MLKENLFFKEVGYFSRHFFIILVGSTLLRFLLAFLFPVFGDACRYFMMARAISINPYLLTKKGLTYPNPLYLVIGACFYRLLSMIHSDLGFAGIRLISPISGTLTILVTYAICRKILSPKACLYSVLLLALSPSHILFSSVGYMESLFLLFVTLAIYFFIRDDLPTRRSIVLCGLSLGLASLTRITGFLLLVILSTYLLLFRNLLTQSTRLRFTLILVSCVLVMTAPYYGRQLWEFGSIEVIGQILPPREKPVSLDSFLYRGEIVAEKSGIQYQDPHYTPMVRLIGTYFEFWGVWGGAVNVLFRTGVLGFPTVILTGFIIITLLITFFHLYGGLTLRGRQEYFLLHICVAVLLLVFFATITVQSVQQGFVSASMGYRKPLIMVAPILAIYGGHGLNQVTKKLEGKSQASRLLKYVVVMSLLFLVLAVGFEGFYMRERYETALTGAAGWLKHNRSKDGAVLTTRSLETAYLADRRTISLSLISVEALDSDLFETHSISHVLIPIKEFTQNSSLDPYMERFQILREEGVLEEVYRDSGAFILEVQSQV